MSQRLLGRALRERRVGRLMRDQQGSNGSAVPSPDREVGPIEIPTEPAPGAMVDAWHAEEREGFSRPRYGVYVNNRAAVFMGEAFSLDRLLDNAVLAEQLGLDFVSVGDSLIAKPRYAAIPLLSAIAARTS